MLTGINFISPIERQITLVEERMRHCDNGYHAEIEIALNHLLASGGKRIRPAVALLTGGMLKGDTDRLVALGASIELLHTATLVHDDLIDGALLRRGMATLNARWSPAATVLTGDFIFAQAAKLAADTQSVLLMKMFAQTLAIIVNGEINQLFSTRRISTVEEYYKRIYAKTASLFELAAGAAAMLSSVSGDTVDSLSRFGYDLGMAFQIVDDILDFTGEQATIGKPVASDLRQGLVTLPFLYYMDKKPGDVLVNAFMAGEPFDIDKMVKSIRSSGAVDQALEEAGNFISQALAILETQPISQERQSLESLAEYIVKRNL